MNPAWRTPGFWTALVGQVVGLTVLIGGLTPEDGQQLQNAAQTVVGGLLVIGTILGHLKSESARKATAVSLMNARLQASNGTDPLVMSACAGSVHDDAKALHAQI